MQLVRRITTILGKVLALLLVLVLVIYAGLVVASSFNQGRQLLGTTLSSLLPDVTIEQPRLTVSGNLLAKGIYLSDQGGSWLEIHDAAVRWSPLALITRSLNVQELSAQRVGLSRLPASAESPEPDDTSATGLALPFSSIQLQQLNIEEVALPASLAGMPAQFSVTGTASYSSSPDTISGALNVTRSGAVQGSANLEVDFDPTDGVVNFRAMVSEAANGLVANLLELEDAPSFTLQMEGGGPLSNWSSSLQVDLNDVRAIDGDVTLSQSGAQKFLTTRLSGELDQFLPASVTSLFSGQTLWFASASLNENYVPLTANARLSTGAITAQLENTYAVDGKVLDAKAQIQTVANNSEPLVLRGGTQIVQLGALTINASASGPLENLDWDLSAQFSQVETHDVDVDDINLSARGEGAQFSDQDMSVPMEVNLRVSGIDIPSSAEDQRIDTATLSLQGTAFPIRKELDFSELHLESDGARAHFDMIEISPENGRAKGELSLSDLSVLSALVGYELSGSVETSFSLLADFDQMSGEIDLSGSSNRVSLQNESVDRVLGSLSQFSAKLSATVDTSDLLSSTGHLDRLTFDNTFGQIEAHGTLQDRQVDGALTAQVERLDLLDPRVVGALNASGTVSGDVSAPDVTLKVRADRVEMDGTPLEQLQLSADGTLSETTPNADIDLSGMFEGQALIGKFKLVSEADKLSIPTLDFEFGGNSLTGHAQIPEIAQLPEGLVGQFTIEANDLSTLSPLVLTEIDGSAQGHLDIQQDGGDARIKFDLTADGLRFEQSSISSFVAEGWIDKPFMRPAANANITLDGVEIEGMNLRSLTMNATPVEGNTANAVATGFSIEADFAENNDKIQSTGMVQAVPDGVVLTLSTLEGIYKGIQTNLRQPATISLLEDRTSVTPFELALGNGTLRVTGSNTGELDISAEMMQLPLSLANAFVSDLDLAGTLNGSARVSGTKEAPQANWQIVLDGFSAKPLADNRILPIQIENSGSFAANQIDQQTIVSNGSGLNVQSSGTINLTGAQELSLTTTGTIPLEVVGAKLIEQNLGGSGGFSLDGTVSGPLRDPQVAIEIRPVDLVTTQFSTGMTLTDYAGAIRITRQEIVIDALEAKFSNNGTLNLNGTLGLGAGLPAQIELTIDGGRYIDGTFISALIDADLRLQGSLADAGSPPSIEGNVTINQADIEIPSSFNSSINPVIVRHLNAPKPVLEQAEILAQDEGRDTEQENEQPSALMMANLNVDVEADGKIFIRGRGVNAEAGGSLNIGGTLSDVRTVGAFSLVRGRIDILSKRLTLSRGNVTFSGPLVPRLDFAATTTSGTTEITVLVSGPADMPSVDFTSVPSLPSDEVLSQLLFGESVDDLSPFQLANLASAISTLTGGTGIEGPLGTLRNLLGVSDIDINFDAAGNPELAVGGYVSERVYLGVTQEATTGDNSAAVDIDVTKFLKLRGQAGSDGDAKAGFYYEREYD
ncbi:DUF490 domain-containing protein [Pseudovibrio japonicus]|uniref:DUF490 domain-containing protein n=1 Tax=Pseudovibrio japonicus TaxID=366534 RepID=A0ABQ3DWR3_9HYPH|nr:translocation/assembly module TamB domain-containing protein [Pseudovibrio japonicus]GHB18715.1 DUF490 domain-containing protein [Pseudovibrio japonicus]